VLASDVLWAAAGPAGVRFRRPATDGLSSVVSLALPVGRLPGDGAPTDDGIRARRYRRLGSLLLMAVGAMVVGGPLFGSPHALELPAVHYGELKSLPPLTNTAHGFYWLGTDRMGHDLLRLVGQAGVHTLAFAAAVALVAVPLGTVGARITGSRPRLATVVARLQAIPAVPLLAPLVAIYQPRAIQVAIAVGVAASLPAAVLLQRQSRASDGPGAGQWLRRMVPVALLVTAGAILSDVVLDFAGAMPLRGPMGGWGYLLQNGMGQIMTHPAPILWPALLIATTCAGCILVALGLRRYST
jgi:dipeptide transport system permease protein